MEPHNLPTTTQIKETFEEEIHMLGGVITETSERNDLLILKSVFKETKEVFPGDRYKSGIALKAVNDEIRVHPYFFRQICSNGMIMGSIGIPTCIGRVKSTASDEKVAEVICRLSDAIRHCCSREILEKTVQMLRSSRETDGDLFLNLLPRISPFVHDRDSGLRISYRDAIGIRYSRERDYTQHGLANAITSVARDTADPKMRWRLEETGGVIIMWPLRTQPSARARIREETVRDMVISRAEEETPTKM